jgi:hypothetical protein
LYCRQIDDFNIGHARSFRGAAHLIVRARAESEAKQGWEEAFHGEGKLRGWGVVFDLKLILLLSAGLVSCLASEIKSSRIRFRCRASWPWVESGDWVRTSL